jgi:hypothetical protein
MGLLFAGLLVAAPPAAADIGVVGVSPTVASPGQQVVLRVGCGFCARGTGFAISLVPVAQAPRPRPCNRNALCAPQAAGPPRERPFVFLGRTRGGRALLPEAEPQGSESQLRFRTPNVQPGRYAFVIFSPERGRGARGVLIADTTGKLLRVQPSVASADSGGNGGGAPLRVAAFSGIVALTIAAVALLMRRRAAA